ncbi:hypothetical protein RDI58_014146 [Solanum bulbocastanum]|uniref:Clp R domain-containing protein n=1 Tax=Solanum bulbocastanum TaxID=147425 RepID=A0AAN8YFU1_SOLBU
MRTNVSFQQALTVESSSIVKQALNLAKRRGHSHVTPLHVASAMLVSSSSTLLRKACFQTNSHPIQYKALELCFNVALNRLPTSASNPILEPHVHPPFLSNALVAAFKRAQAYQRRGSVENQQLQQHLKVEIDQLVISILDDPSVSRVMSEAGFSSIQLKTNVEHAISSKNSTKPMVIASGNNLKLSLCKSGDDPSVSRVMREAGFSIIQLKTNVEHAISSEISCKNSAKSMVLPPGDNLKLSLGKSSDDQIKNDDVISVIEVMMNKKRRNTVIVAECLASAEGVVRGVVDKFDKGEVSSHMKHVQFISVPLSTLRNVSKEEFEAKIKELRILLKSCIHRGVVLYLGDLEWISEFWTKVHNEQKNNYMILELSRLLCGKMSENGSLWLMGIASFPTYTKCKTGCPSLQTLWDLHPLTLPVVSVDLSLNLERHKKEETWLLFLGVDSHGKEKISKELAKIIFGSQDCFIAIGLSTFSSSTRTDSTDQEVNYKRSRDEKGRSYLERFTNAIQENPRRVFFMEDMDQVDSFSQKGIQKAIETGKLTLPNGDLVLIKESIIIFSCEEYFSSISRTCFPRNIQKFSEENNASLDLNIAIGENRVEKFVYNFGIFEAVDKQIMFKI